MCLIGFMFSCHILEFKVQNINPKFARQACWHTRTLWKNYFITLTHTKWSLFGQLNCLLVLKASSGQWKITCTAFLSSAVAKANSFLKLQKCLRSYKLESFLLSLQILELKNKPQFAYYARWVPWLLFHFCDSYKWSLFGLLNSLLVLKSPKGLL